MGEQELIHERLKLAALLVVHCVRPVVDVAVADHPPKVSKEDVQRHIEGASPQALLH